MNFVHGYLSNDIPNVKPNGEFNKGLQVPAQMVFNSSKVSIEVGKRRYQFQGSAIEIIEFLEKNKEMKFTGKSLGDDGKWGVGKDPKNSNVSFVITTHNRLILSSLQKAIAGGGQEIITKPVRAIVTGGVADFISEGAEAINNLENFSESLQSSKGFAKSAIKDAASQVLLGQLKPSFKHKNDPSVSPNSTLGKVRKAWTNIEKASAKIIGKIPEVGKDIHNKIRGLQINIKVDTYINPDKEKGAYIDTGSSELTFGDLASNIKEKIYGEVNEQQESNVDSLDNHKPVRDKNPLNDFINPQVDKITTANAQENRKPLGLGQKVKQVDKKHKQQKTRSRKNIN